MSTVSPSNEVPESTFFDWGKDILLKWTPRVIVCVIAGYYSLGIAYDIGLMAEIDRIAIPILKNWVGYAGLGAIMPTFQWYAAWAVRVIAAAIAGLIYDLLERLILCLINSFRGESTETDTKDVRSKV